MHTPWLSLFGGEIDLHVRLDRRFWRGVKCVKDGPLTLVSMVFYVINFYVIYRRDIASITGMNWCVCLHAQQTGCVERPNVLAIA